MKRSSNLFLSIILKILNIFVIDRTEYLTIAEDIEYRFCNLINSKNKLLVYLIISMQLSVILYFRIQESLKWSITMFNNYLKIAIRNLTKYKGFSLINIMGLTLGITCFSLISLYVNYELSFNSFHTQKDRIFRVAINDPGWNYRGSNDFSMTNSILTPTIMEDFIDVEYATRFRDIWGVIEYNNKIETWGYFGDNYFFKLFDFKFKNGNISNALYEPFSIVLTEDLAKKIFGEEDPLNKVIKFNNQYNVTITGIIENIPENSQISFDYILSLSSMAKMGYSDLSNWNKINSRSFVLLKEGVPYHDFEKKLIPLVESHHKYETEDLKPKYFLQPLPDLYLKSNLNFDFKTGNLKYIYIFSTIAVLIMFIACMNYINCATARAIKRQKEIGIRKSIGAHRSQIIKQFLGESYLITSISAFFALIAIIVILPAFNSFVGKDLDLNMYLNPNIYIGFILLVITVGTISGLYPAILISSYNPVRSLKNIFSSSRRSIISTRNILVLIQFSITIVLLIFTITIQKQLNYIKTKDVGFERENVLITHLNSNVVRSKFQIIKSILLDHPNIINLTNATNTAYKISNVDDARIKTDNEIITIPRMNKNYSDHEFINVNKMKIVKGRNFSINIESDINNAVIINETAARIAGLTNPIGKMFALKGDEFNKTIIGVVKDFHFTSFKMDILPVALIFDPNKGNTLSIKIKGENINELLEFIKSTFLSFDKEYIFSYWFLDESYNNQYKSDQKLAELLSTFSIITIFIAILGLIGLISYVAEQLTKEIGIRKTLGATVSNIVTLISSEFLVLLVISNIIAWPIGYYIVNNWLQEFVYKISLGVNIFILAGAIVLFIAIITMSFQTIKSALSNPVDSLKYE